MDVLEIRRVHVLCISCTKSPGLASLEELAAADISAYHAMGARNTVYYGGKMSQVPVFYAR